MTKNIYAYNPTIPDCEPNPMEISKQLRINADILKQEITDHIDSELKRFKSEKEKINNGR